MGTKRHLLVRWAETSHTTWPGTNPNHLNHADRHINRWTDKRTDGQTLVQSRPLAGAFGITIKSTQSHEDTHSGSRPTPRHTPRKTPGLTHIHVYTFLFREMCTILVAVYLKLLRTLQPFTRTPIFDTVILVSRYCVDAQWELNADRASDSNRYKRETKCRIKGQVRLEMLR